MTLYYETRGCIQADHIPSRYRFVLFGVVVVQYDVDVRGCYCSNMYGHHDRAGLRHDVEEGRSTLSKDIVHILQ